jgi:hypothetical protein
MRSRTETIRSKKTRTETPGHTAWRLLLADDPKLIAEIEAAYGMTQEETVCLMPISA